MTSSNWMLSKEKAGLLVIDVQDALWPTIDRTCDVGKAMQTVIRGCRILGLPLMVTEQIPQKLGATIEPLHALLPENQPIFTKTSFSCCGDPQIKEKILSMPIEQWIVIGIEAHVCVLETVKDLLNDGKQVVVLNDAISSRSIFTYSTAIAEMRDCGARISCVETVLFELTKDCTAPEFRSILALIR